MAIQKKPLENKPNLSKFRPFDCFFTVKVGSNGLLSNTYKMKLLGGPDAKRYQVKLIEAELSAVPADCVAAYSLSKNQTAQGLATSILMMLASTSFTTNAARRLPANSRFELHFKIVSRRADGSIAVSLKEVVPYTVAKSASGKKVLKAGTALDRSDDSFRKFRKSVKLLASVFETIELESDEVRKQRLREERVAAKKAEREAKAEERKAKREEARAAKKAERDAQHEAEKAARAEARAAKKAARLKEQEAAAEQRRAARAAKLNAAAHRNIDDDFEL